MLNVSVLLKRLTLCVLILMISFLQVTNAQTATITVNGSTSLCQGDSVLLTASSGDAYQWSNFGVPILGETNQTYYAKQTGEFTVTVINNLVPSISAPVSITVNQVPSIFINTSASSICSGTPVSLSLGGSNNASNAANFNSGLVSSNDYVMIPHQSQLNTGVVTVEAWVRPQLANTAATIISKLPPSTSTEIGWAFRLTSANKFQFVIGNEVTNTVAEINNAVSIGPWYHLTGTFDGSTARLYVNGSQAASVNVSATINSTYPVIVGNQNSLNAPYKGFVDELRIWNQVKTNSDIQCNYKVSTSPTASNLVGYWRMNEITSGATPDVTSFHNDGVAFSNTSLISSSAGINNLFTWQPAPGITNTSSACITVTPLVTTTYVATATNAAGCSKKDSVTVTVLPAGQLFNVTGGGVYCSNGPAVAIGLSGSETGVLYQLKLGAQNVGAAMSGTGNPLTLGTVTTAGTYTVIAVNTNCTNTMTGNAIVTTASSPSITGGMVTNAQCNGGNTGSIDVSVSNGTPSYSYLWSNNAVSQDLMNVAAGMYKLTVTDSKGCKATDSFTVNQPSAPIVSATVNNITCNGANNGNISLTTGGTAPYTFNWSTGATTQNISNLIPGNYSVFVTDAIGCISSGSYTVSQPAVLSLSATVSNVACFGGNNGSIDLTVTGGTAPYTYLWSNSSTAQDPSGLSAGSYSVTVTDANGCIKTGSFTVNQPAVLAASAVAANVNCFNGNSGSINLTVTGGNMPYTYLWNNGATVEDPSALVAGNYSVAVTDAKGCTASASATISQPTQIAISGTTTNVNCFAASTGAINISVSGGTPGYTYSWSNGATTQNVSNIQAGTHTVTVTDSKGCIATASFTITQPSAFVITKSMTMPNCHGDHNGAIDITASGGAGPYNYSWSNSATTEDISNLAAGNYTITVSYANSCTYTEIITLTEPGLLAPVATPISTTCLGNNHDGGVDLSVTGGTAPYSYVWSNSATTEDISNLTFGTYSVNVTDAHGCTASGSATVTQPTPVTISGVVTDVTCYGAGNGSINVTPLTGMAPFSYQWSNNSTTEDPTGLQPGSYSVMVTDNRNCTTTASFNITQPASALTSAIAGSNNILCYGASTGNIDLSVAGGTSPYTYNWSNNTTTQDLTSVPAGAYNVIVTDAKGCTSGQMVTLTQPAAALAIAKTATNITCNGQNNGAINTTVTGGTTPYTYNWSNSATSQNLANLAPGNYMLTVTDGNGCTATNATTITQPAALTIAAVASNVTCNGLNNGNINVTVTGGTMPYAYSWNNNATSEDLFNLTPGNYSLAVTDANGCTAAASYTITEPAVLNASVSKTDVTCFGGNNGTVTLTVTGGNTPYSFQWSNNATTQNLSAVPAGNYNVFVTDAKGCLKAAAASISQPSTAVSVSGVVTHVTAFGGNNGEIDITPSGGVPPYTYSWSNNLTNEDPTGLTAGTYTVTVTDASGCTKLASFTINQPAAMVLTGTVTNALCSSNSGGVSLTVTGGIPPYTYLWSNNATTQNLSNVGGGTYSVTVTDSVGSIATNSFTISQTSNMNITAVITDVKCYGSNNGKIVLTVSGGVTPYSYKWDNNSTSKDRNNLGGGFYTVTVKDATGCSMSETFYVYAPDEPLTVTGSTADVSCFGSADGAIDGIVSGGTEPYSYKWTITGDTTEDINNLNVGTYKLTVTDDHGCKESENFHISQPNALAVSGSKTNVTCNGGNDGGVNLSVQGGTTPYTYNWSNGSTSKNLSNVVAGTYTVVVTDNNGCTKSATFTLTQPPVINVTAVVVNNKCYGDNDGDINLYVSGGTGSSFSYKWENNSTSQDRHNLVAGTYTVTITNSGCSIVKSYTITQPAAPLAITGVKTNVSCYNAHNGAIAITVTGGTAPYSYKWDNNYYLTSKDRTNLDGGTYSLKVTDANGCTETESFTITEPSQLNIAATVTNVSCFGGNNGAVNITVSGGTTPYTYNWTGGITTQDISGKAAGTYTVVVTDANGCTQTATYTITQPAAALAISGVVTNTCYGISNGAVNITVTGGTTPYSYSWSSGSNSQDISNKPAGTYTVTVTDAKGCSQSAAYIITQPTAPLALTAVKTNVSCKYGNNGSINLTVTGGNAPYTYSWNGGVTTEDRSNLEDGSYSVTVTDASGCTASASYSITEPSSALSVSGVTTNVACNGGSTGAVNVSVSGGGSPYTYSWSNGATTQDISGVVTGSYTLTVTDANGCAKTATYTITQPAAIVITGTVSNTCGGTNNGAVNISVSGGAAPYTYSWTGGATTQDISSKPAGTYTVTVTDANGCTKTASFTIGQVSNAMSITAAVTNVSCNGDDNGAIDITVAGGVAPYTYQWSNNNSNCYWWLLWCYYHYYNNSCNMNTQDISGLEAGTYSVTITDANGCTKTASFTVTEPTAISAGISVSPVVTVTNGQNYTIYLGYGPQSVTLTAAATGGTAPYTYSWSGSGISGTSTSVSVSPTSTKTYTLTVTDAKGCTKTVTRTIYVIDVRYGSDKIIVCHNGYKTYVYTSTVATHLAHGDNLGDCNDWGCGDKSGNNNDDNTEENTGEQQATAALSDMIVKNISIYPNPSEGAFTLQLPEGAKNGSVMITDMNGKLVERRVVNGVNTIGFDLSHIAKGTYSVYVTVGSEVYTAKLILK